MAELITNLIKFKRNVYWCVGWRLKYHNESFGLQGLKTSRVRPHCLVCGLAVVKRNAAILSEGQWRLLRFRLLQQAALHGWLQHKVGTLVYGRASGTERSQKWVRKMVSFRPWFLPVEEKE